jgi:hypothetical protein
MVQDADSKVKLLSKAHLKKINLNMSFNGHFLLSLMAYCLHRMRHAGGISNSTIEHGYFPWQDFALSIDSLLPAPRIALR